MPARLADIARACRALGIDVEAPGRGSHWKALRDGTVYPLPAHNGPKSELDDIYIRGLCRAFGLNEREFRKLL